ncbi:MAG: DMP19 family protein [Prevotellaceae bacterium]|jgi:hypothetical protein|nr:DMP19 family protein [Prevotellaceae bacterium]
MNNMENEKAFLPEISRQDIENAKDDAWKLIYVFLDKYFEMIENGNITGDFNEYQHTLLAYMYLDSQVCNGGFIQLINNGYGGYIFDTPFSGYLKSWGAEKTAQIVDKAKEIYIKYQEELEAEKEAEEFCGLYKKITDFEPLEEEYYKINDGETEKIKEYVENNIHNFAKIL